MRRYVRDCHYDVALRVQFVRILAHRFHQRQGVIGAQCLWSGEDLQIFRHRADHAHLETIDLKNHVGLRREQFALWPHQVRADDGVSGYIDKMPRLLPPVVEIVIAQRGRVEAQHVRDLEYRQSVKNGGYGRALRHVARVEQDAIGAVGALTADHAGKVGKPAMVVLQRQQPRMQVVGVQDGQRAYRRHHRQHGQSRQRDRAA